MTLSGDALSLTTGLHDVSRAAGATVHSARAGLGERAPSAAVAVRRAAESAGRAAALLLPDELASALSEVAAASAAHVPLVVHVACAPGDDTSAVAPLCETGAAVLSTWSPTEGAACAAVALHRAALDSELPFVHVYEATEGAAPLLPFASDAIEAVLGPAHPRAVVPLDPDRARVRSFAARAPFAMAAALRAAGERAGTPVPLLERFETADADEVIVTYGRTFPLACSVARAMRASGRKVGVLGVRALRPFFAADVVKAISRAKSAVAIEPLDAPLTPTGPLAACVKGAFFDALTWAPGFPASAASPRRERHQRPPLPHRRRRGDRPRRGRAAAAPSSSSAAKADDDEIDGTAGQAPRRFLAAGVPTVRRSRVFSAANATEHLRSKPVRHALRHSRGGGPPSEALFRDGRSWWWIDPTSWQRRLTTPPRAATCAGAPRAVRKAHARRIAFTRPAARRTTARRGHHRARAVCGPA
ncbi:MAG: hypothetical protein R3B70_24515 [Polyangiaceae bacterium]